MPDLTIVIMQECASKFKTNIGGYQQGGFEYGEPFCNCLGYKFHRTCKHIKAAEEKKCFYHEQIDGPPEEKGKCPKCGSPTRFVKVGI